MANDFSPSFPDVWAREQQEVFFKVNVGRQLCKNWKTLGDISYGDTLVRTYRSTDPTSAPAVYVRGTDMTYKEVSDTAETMTINRQFGELIYIDNFDKIQNAYDAAADYGRDQGIILSNQIDADILAEALNAYSTVDAGTLGGTSGQGITVSVSNIFSIFSSARRKLEKLNVMVEETLYSVVTPEVKEIITQYYAAKNTMLGDKVSTNGYLGNVFGWWELYSSNNVTTRATLALATNPSDGEKVTMSDGSTTITLTFVSSIGTTAGNVLIGANVDATRASAAALLNAPGTTNSTQVALGTSASTGSALEAYKKAVARISASNDNTADTLTVTWKGAGVMTVTETLSAGADVWTAALQKQYLLFGVKGNPVLVVQSEPGVVVKDHPFRNGKNILNTVLYGVKTYRDNSRKMVKVEVRTDTFSN